MIPKMFDKHKENILAKADKSHKKRIDKEIKHLVELINSKKNYVTTSSCAGRIVLLKVIEDNRKKDSKWLFSSHQPVKFSELDLSSIDGEVWFKQESMILHVCCRDLKSAIRMWDIAKEVGFKRPGILPGKKLYHLEIVGSEFIEAIIAKEGELLVDEHYLKELLKEANRKLLKNRKRMEKFYSALKF